MYNKYIMPATDGALRMPGAADILSKPEERVPVMPTVETPSVMRSEKAEDKCNYKTGELPPCAPLAAGFVPFQRPDSPRYAPEEGLTRGTLFPGLDLPFMNIANKSNPYAGTPLGELMALGFAIHEIGLYLDTHKDDKEAFALMKNLMALRKEGHEKYVREHGPVSKSDLISMAVYNWTDDPWPWEVSERMARE